MKGCKGCLVVTAIIVVVFVLVSVVGVVGLNMAFGSSITALKENIGNLQNLAGQGSETLSEATAMMQKISQGEPVSAEDKANMLAKLDAVRDQLEGLDDSHPVMGVLKSVLAEPILNQITQLENQLKNQQEE